jgi:hypothetical protein
VLEIAVLDALGLENSVARSRTLIAGALAAAKLLEAEQIESFAISIEDDGCHDQAIVWVLIGALGLQGSRAKILLKPHHSVDIPVGLPDC